MMRENQVFSNLTDEELVEYEKDIVEASHAISDPRSEIVPETPEDEKLLDNLKNITAKEDKFQTKSSLSLTNRYWPDTNITSLPSSYDKAKRHKNEDGEEFIYIDRVYGGLFDYELLEQKNGTTYKGKLYKKRRLIESADDKNFY